MRQQTWRTLSATFVCAALVSSNGFAQAERSKQLVDELNLKFLNVEAGLFDVVRVSELEVEIDGEKSAASNVIYLMLNRDQPINYVQWLFSDDYQVLIEGGPADYYLFYADGSTEKITMGRDIAAGQKMIVPAPGGTAKAIVLHDEAEYILMGSILSPAWSPHRVRIGGDQAFVDRYRNTSDWASDDFIKTLIGPNFGHYTGGETDELELTIMPDGQVIWLQMQLTQKQLDNQLRRFSEQQPGKPVSLEIEHGAPQGVVDSVTSAIEKFGLDLAIQR
ncbi:MAG: cupin domain-containing protein [Woeseiaceae bacterium]|nr:cupin domain-containing protein [Woeseiaceae bacterium]